MPPELNELRGFRTYVPMDNQENGGADFSPVRLDEWGKPSCVTHGAMNKVSPILWRCITAGGAQFNPCRAGCQEKDA